MQDDIELIRKTLDETPIWDACDKATDRIISKLENGAAEKAFQDALKDHDFNQEVMRMGLEIAYIDIDFKAGWEAHAARSGWVAIDDPIVDDWKDGRDVDLFIQQTAIFEEGGQSETRKYIFQSRWMKKEGRWAGLYYKHNDPERRIATHAMLPPPPPQSKGGE